MAPHGRQFLLWISVVMGMLASCGGPGGSENGLAVETASTGGGFEGLSLGEIEDLDFTSSTATLDFQETEEGEFLLILNTLNESGDFTVRLTQGSATSITQNPQSPAALDLEEPMGPESFHQFLREMEGVLAQTPDFNSVAPPSSLAALTALPDVGDRQTFRVLSTMNSITTYEEVTADLRLLTDNLLVFVDEENGGQVSDNDLRALAQDFEGISLPRERELFGHESDLNLDRHITILMTCVVNRMANSGGIVTGFFFPGDFYQRSSVNPVSNAQEIFYTLVPDPYGDCGTPISAGFALTNLLPGVLAHEFQHMVSFNNHIFRNGGTTEEAWLNEDISHLAEDLGGFGNENPSRVKLFLSQPSRTPLIPLTSPTLPERGAGYLFLRYLYEQSADGDGFLQRLSNTGLTGVANLESAFRGEDPDFDEFAEFLNRWSLALALSETGVTSDPRYNYRERSSDPETGNFTGVCIRCEAQDGRGTVLGGPVITTVSTYPAAATLKGTASQFFRLQDPMGEVSVSGSGGATMAGSLVRFQGP